MTDFFTFANTEASRALRANLVDNFHRLAIDFRVFEEDWETEAGPVHVLRLEKLGKRPGEGQIAKAMKASKR